MEILQLDFMEKSVILTEFTSSNDFRQYLSEMRPENSKLIFYCRLKYYIQLEMLNIEQFTKTERYGPEFSNIETTPKIC